jgi:hypothetical protein
MVAQNFNSFGEAIVRKLVAEIALLTGPLRAAPDIE